MFGDLERHVCEEFAEHEYKYSEESDDPAQGEWARHLPACQERARLRSLVDHLKKHVQRVNKELEPKRKDLRVSTDAIATSKGALKIVVQVDPRLTARVTTVTLDGEKQTIKTEAPEAAETAES